MQIRAAPKLVVIRAKKAGFRCCLETPTESCCSHAKIVALMGEFYVLGSRASCANVVALAHHYREAVLQGDSAVYGVVTDSVDIRFYKIDNWEVRMLLRRFLSRC